MKIIDILVDISNNGVREKTKLFKYFDILDEEFNVCMEKLEDIYFLLYNGRVDINDEVEFIEDTPKENNKINKIRVDYNSINIDKAFEMGSTTFFREDIEIFQCLSSKINEIIDRLNGEE